MTDRYNAFIVVLSVDMRSDDAQKVRDAINQIKISYVTLLRP